MYSYSIISPQARTASTRGISTIRRSFRETQGRFIWPPTSKACQKKSTTSKDLDRKNEIGPIYAPYKEENRSVTTTNNKKRRKSSGTKKKDLLAAKKTFRKRSVGKTRRKRERQEDLSEAKRREDPPRARSSRRPSGTEIAGKNFQKL